jgi:DNA-binding transcriptional LysR family regulator
MDQLLEDWEQLKRDAQNLSSEVRGSVRLGVHASVACYFLPRFVPQLLRRYPHVELQLQNELSRNVLQNILDHQMDLGLVINPQKHPELVLTELLTDEVNIWKRKDSIHDTLIYDPSLLQSHWILKHLKNAHSYTRKIESSNLEVITSLLRAGAGHAILPKRVAQMVPLDLETAQHRSFRDSLCLVYRPAFRKTALGRAVIDAIRAHDLK